MKKDQKPAEIAELTDKLKRAKVAVLTDYRGLTVTQVHDLRGKLRAQDIEYRVVKNTLARRAAVEAGHEVLSSSLVGPVAMAIGYADLSAPAKAIVDWTKATRLKLDILGALVEGRVFNPDDVKKLADLPSREALIAQLLGTLQSPIAQLVGTIEAPVQQLVGVLNAYKTKMEAA